MLGAPTKGSCAFNVSFAVIPKNDISGVNAQTTCNALVELKRGFNGTNVRRAK